MEGKGRKNAPRDGGSKIEGWNKYCRKMTGKENERYVEEGGREELEYM